MNDLARARFAWLLNQRGIPFCDQANLERLISIRETRPDFYARPLGFPPFLAKVGEPGEEGPALLGEAPAGTDERAHRRLSRVVRHAARHLRPHKQLGVAMVVVLDDGLLPVPLGAQDLIHLAGALESRRPYVSAILVNLLRLPLDRAAPLEPERPRRARILHNPAAAIPLHLGIFLEPEDEHIGRSEEQWVDLRSDLPLSAGEGPR